MASPSPRRRFQFSLRTLMIGVTLLAVVCGWFMQQMALLREEFHAEQGIVAAIEQRGGKVTYEDVGPFWARRFAGTEDLTIGMRVTHVRFEPRQARPAPDTSTVRTIELLRSFGHFCVVHFSYATFADPPELGGTSPEEVKRELTAAISEEAY
jgi:hypothetical protein